MNKSGEEASPPRPLVLAGGHFPPPVHGMAVATERIVALIDQRADVRVLVISANKTHGLLRHPARVARTMGAIYRMCVDRRRSETLYFGSDAGLGMAYTLAVVLAGRMLRYHVFLHHHSAAYVQNNSSLMAAIVRCGGRRCSHVLSCDRQAKTFDSRYRPQSPSVILPICYALDPEHENPDSGSKRGPAGAKLVLGHMSNLSLEKGLERVFQTLHGAVAAGLDARLVLAGPAATARDEVALRELLAEAEGQVVYMGPVREEAKERFFAAIDVFLLPTRYRHESFGLVAAEAMQAGIPVIAYRTGCLDAGFVRGAGLVLEPTDDYPKLAVEQLVRWAADPQALGTCASQASVLARAAREDALLRAAEFVDILIRPRG